MKTLKKQFKSIALILSMLILLQGCTVYKASSVSLEQATLNKSKVKIMTKNNVKLKFERIVVEDGNYYGIRTVDSQNVKLLLDTNTVEMIKEKDKILSTILSIGIPIVSIIGVSAGVWLLVGY
jgi:hypothetical protein